MLLLSYFDQNNHTRMTRYSEVLECTILLVILGYSNAMLLFRLLFAIVNSEDNISMTRWATPHMNLYFHMQCICISTTLFSVRSPCHHWCWHGFCSLAFKTLMILLLTVAACIEQYTATSFQFLWFELYARLRETSFSSLCFARTLPSSLSLLHGGSLG